MNTSPRAGALRLVSLLVLLLCALACALPDRAASPEPLRHAELWPSEWAGRPLQLLVMSSAEYRLAERFPGRVGRFSDGTQVLVLREVHTPTRELHPAADCYRGAGHRVAGTRLESDAAGALWRCFTAERDGAKQQVCERIVDALGRGFTDTSGWYWAALTGHSRGPWQAVIRASMEGPAGVLKALPATPVCAGTGD
jgi:hypothetical protein